MTTQEAINLARKDIHEGKSWRVFEHPEHPSQIAYDMERWFYEQWTSIEHKQQAQMEQVA